MTKEQQEVLLRNHVFLVDEIHPADILHHLVQDEIITLDMQEGIEAATTRKAKAVELLKLLPRRGPRSFRCFINALKEAGQSYVIDKMLKPV